MNCANHPDAPAVAYCRTCGKPLCATCSHDIRGVVYCEECLATHLSATMPPVAGVVPPVPERPKGAPSPKVAAILGVIPGVGAMYNGEFAKGFIHVLIFATLIWMSDNISGMFGLAIAIFVIYMPIEAYKTAKARELGLPSPDPLGINNWFSSSAPANRGAAVASTAVPVAPMDPNAPVPPVAPVEPVAEDCRSRMPVGAFILIGLGVLFLLDEVGALHFDWIWRFWPLILIAIGVRILMQRQRRGW